MTSKEPANIEILQLKETIRALRLQLENQQKLESAKIEKAKQDSHSTIVSLQHSIQEIRKTLEHNKNEFQHQQNEQTASLKAENQQLKDTIVKLRKKCEK